MSNLTSERLFENAFHLAAIGMALVGLDGRWLRVNRSLCKLVGYTEAELLHRTFQDITHAADLDLDLLYVGALLHGEIPSYDMEKRYLHKSGRIIWVQLHVSLVRDEKGRPEVFIAQIQDIAARKKAELELDLSLREEQRLLGELRERNAQVEQLRSKFVRICAWTKRIFYEGEWISLEYFLSKCLNLKLTHGISEEAYEQVMTEMEEEEKLRPKAKIPGEMVSSEVAS